MSVLTTIINNKDSILIDELAKQIKLSTQVYIACDYVTSFALFDLFKNIKDLSSLKLLVSFTSDEDDFRFIQSQRESKRVLDLTRKFSVGKVIKLLDDKIEIRSGTLGQQNMIIVKDDDSCINYSLTPQVPDSITIGTESSTDLIMINAMSDASGQYLSYFDQVWQQSPTKLNSHITNLLSKATKDYTGEEIYKYCLRHIFQYSTIDERADEKLQKVGFKDSKVWDLLYNFQKDAVIGAIEKIETYGGCIIADSVGLGKTFEALGVIKYYQLRNFRTLVL